MNDKMYLCPDCEGEAVSNCETCNENGTVEAKVISRRANELDECERPKYLLDIIAPDMATDDTNFITEEILSGIAPLLSDYVSVRDLLMIEIYVEEIREKGYFVKEEEF